MDLQSFTPYVAGATSSSSLGLAGTAGAKVGRFKAHLFHGTENDTSFEKRRLNLRFLSFSPTPTEHRAEL